MTKKQTLLIMTGFSCNSNCLMCSVRPKAEFYSNRSTQEIIDDLLRGKNQGYQEVEFTGGEPTIRSDILDLIKLAKKLNYKKIAISTNGRMLSYDKFCKDIVKNGVNSLTFTINAHNKKLGDAISRTPKSFEQSLRGIRNAVREGLDVSVNTVVFKLNYKKLEEIGSLIKNLGVKTWHMLDLIPDGYAKDLYQNLSVNPIELSKEFNSLKIINAFGTVLFFDFPMCLFSSDLIKNPDINFITAQGRTEISKQTGYNPERFSQSNNTYEDIHKKRIDICKKCKFNNECGGIWKESLDLYGEEAIKFLAKKHKVLK